MAVFVRDPVWCKMASMLQSRAMECWVNMRQLDPWIWLVVGCGWWCGWWGWSAGGGGVDGGLVRWCGGSGGVGGEVLQRVIIAGTSRDPTPNSLMNMSVS